MELRDSGDWLDYTKPSYFGSLFNIRESTETKHFYNNILINLNKEIHIKISHEKYPLICRNKSFKKTNHLFLFKLGNNNFYPLSPLSVVADFFLLLKSPSFSYNFSNYYFLFNWNFKIRGIMDDLCSWSLG